MFAEAMAQTRDEGTGKREEGICKFIKWVK
jgi:hypothetical protein